MHIVIIGNGIAGITAARNIRKQSDFQITVISGESEYFFSRTALMYIYMGHMKFEHTKPYEDWFWEKNKITLKKAWVEGIDNKAKQIAIKGEQSMAYDRLIIATGAIPNKFGWLGQDLDGVSGMYSLQDLENIEKHTKAIKRGVIVGGGLIGIELTEMLHSRGIGVTFLVREKNFWDIVLPLEEAKLIDQEILDHHIDLRLGTELKEILSDDNGTVRGVVTGDGEEIPCQFVGLTVGVSPNIGWLKNSPVEVNRGVIVNEYLETNLLDVYAIGDCAEHKDRQDGRRPIEQVWYTARMMGEVVARSITESKTVYRPDKWFNSAKFFNIEYQTYGQVTAQPSPGQEAFYWQSDDKKKCLRVVFDEKSTEIIGVNVFGIRMRHDVWNNWLNARKTISFAMENLEQVNFDPEFFYKYETNIRNSFNNEYDYMRVKNPKRSIIKRLFA